MFLLCACVLSLHEWTRSDTIKSTSISNKKNPSFSAFLVSTVNILALTLKAPNSVMRQLPLCAYNKWHSCAFYTEVKKWLRWRYALAEGSGNLAPKMWNVNPKWGFPYTVPAARFTNKLVILYGLLSQEGLISHRRINPRRQRPLFWHFVSISVIFPWWPESAPYWHHTFRKARN